MEIKACSWFDSLKVHLFNAVKNNGYVIYIMTIV